jgi:hypothetical protein
MLLEIGAIDQKVDLRPGIRPAIESARAPEDVYGLAVGCLALNWALPPLDDIVMQIRAKPALINDTPAGRANRAILDHVETSPDYEKIKSQMNARTPAPTP